MPKKFKGENSKAVVAKARKAEAKAIEDERREKAIEDEKWRDDDKYVARKQERKASKDKKRQEDLERKLAKKQLLEEEEAALAKISAKPQSTKLTRTEIQQELEKQEQQRKEKAKRNISVNEDPLEENPNIPLEEGAVEARSVEDAIAVLSVKESQVERHPERRMKAAYQAFEEENLPRLKADFPNFRLSQLKQMLKKDWMKSPENPMNQRSESYNKKR
ncbi:coiled-coil domain-containing protein 124-like [Saccoglossus kowalevskii]|uniref:Coiled-coil domain-containing protein 124-like n=1 Tax=Saccoglossus kowalevskii TaxID=10224 RepID=A0ABM0GS77_SACKO|nr:PREDICTED: coiled-coil domain-containing protein 124-like [Saccoglossus kowalevskii]